MVTSSTFSAAPPRAACTKHLLKGMFCIHSVRASE
jgi:hypothetical protein